MTPITRGKALASLLVMSWMAWLIVVLLRDTRPAALLLGYLEHSGLGLMTAGLLVAGAWGIGSPARRKLLPDFGTTDPVSGGLLSIALGWIALQCVTVLLGSLGLLTVWPARSLVGLSVAAFLLELRRSTGIRALFRVPRYPVATGIAWAGAGALLLPTLFAAGAPALGPDEVQYHYRFIEQIIRTGGFVANPEDPISGFAQGFHATSALAYSVAGGAALRPLSLVLGLLTIVCGERITRRTFGPGAALIYLPVAVGAASLVRFLPTIGTDLPMGFFVTMATLVVLDWSQAPTSAGLRSVILGLLGGAALAIKFTAALYLAPLYLALLIMLWRSGAGRQATVRPLLVAGSLSALFTVPWLVKNLVHCGHPLYPILGMQIPEAAAAAFRFNFTENYGAGTGWVSRMRTPWDLFLLGREFDHRHFLGRLNGWPLLALPGVLLVARQGRQAQVLITLVALGFLAWAQVLRRVAYLLPLWPMIAALAAGGLASLGSRLSRRQRRPLAVVLAVMLAASASAEVASPYVDLLDDAAVASGLESRAAYIDKKLPGAEALRWVKAHVDPAEPIALLWTWHGLDLPHSLHWIGAEEFTPLRLAVHEAGSAEGFRDQLKKRGIRWALARRHRFIASNYPLLSEDDFRVGFDETVLRVDETLSRYAIRRFASGPFVVYEIP